ncbi:DUF58 domain-containing protein [Actinocrinis puniceicyclus]|uniref:DUF58 domain-containing protein n=1 Tax=Actinocrinis puniceicyclus TaxID=977794 RepID=A0A8J8BET3_9ACTN|nr:DUF58 domain-containing protein [Actinocrinis puniceicyclus]MBS2964074.1 DUF58 domain-containing protein [Actinocrinis puniceicyclus]
MIAHGGEATDSASAAAVRRALDGREYSADPAAPPTAPTRRWRLSERALRLSSVALTAAALALITGRAWLLALAAGPAVLLALGAPGSTRPTRLGAQAAVPVRRCFEGEPITARVELAFDGLAGWIDPGLAPGPGVELTGVEVSGPSVTFSFAARRWGRWTLGTADIDLHDLGGLARRTVRVELGEVDVYPLPAESGLSPVPARLPQRLGEHTARHPGEGFEFAGVHPYAWGERQRRIHWPSTTRRGAIQITSFAAERATDAVVLLDAFGDLRDPGTGRSTLDDSVRAAAGIARAYLRSHDRVGIVSVGGRLRWLQPGTSGGHLYRIIETVLEVRRDLGYHTPVIDHVPAPALPHGALVYAITPLADDRILDLLRDLAERGNPMVVVEIPTGEPRAEPEDEAAGYALRLWRLDRQALHFSLVERGIPVVSWDGTGELDLALAPLLRSPVRGRQR